MKSVIKIVSGGQTGADRAGLDSAIDWGIAHGGWCPTGRKAEDGAIPPRYDLLESTSANYLQRTEWNARDADATVIFTLRSDLTGGSKKTAEFAQKHGKPWIHLNEGLGIEEAAVQLKSFIAEHGVKVLNVAGSRGSKEPGVATFVRAVIGLSLDGARAHANQKTRIPTAPTPSPSTFQLNDRYDL